MAFLHYAVESAVGFCMLNWLKKNGWSDLIDSKIKIHIGIRSTRCISIDARGDCRFNIKWRSPCRVRGLEQLLRSRKLLTVGDLSALTEYAVHNLPIRSPKIVVMRRALQGFANSVGAKPPPPPPDSGATCEREAEAATTAEETMFDTSNDGSQSCW